MSASGCHGRGRGKRFNRSTAGPPEPYRSQSMAIKPEKFHPGNKDNNTSNRPPSSSSGRRSNGDQRKSTSRSSTARAKSTRFFRDPIHSAVPETALVSFASRPDQGGIAGRQLNLQTNHFICNIPRTLKCHQYDIDLQAANRDGTWRPAKKDDRFIILRKIIERENFPLVWYDEGKSLYSIELLVDLKDQYEIIIKDKKSDREQKYRLLIINLVKSYDIQTLWDFIENRIAIRPRDPIRILETLLKQTTRATMVCVKNQFYDRRQELDDLGLASGFYQAMFLTRIGATININSTFTCFYQPFNLVHFLCEYLQHDIVQDGIDEREQQLLLRKVLKPIWLETHHGENVRKYRIRGFGASARQHTFARHVDGVDDDSQERQSVSAYFKEKYNIQLQYPDLLTVELYTPPNKTQFHYLPMECCTIQAWQRSIKPLTTDQRARVTKKTVVNPGQRYKAIMDIVKTRNFNADRYLNEIGMSINDDKMITVPARCIPPPEIKYKSGRDGISEIVERINIGKWNLRNRFQTTKSIKRWACVMVSTQKPNNNQLSIANQFVGQFPLIIAQYGIYFESSPIMSSDPANPEVIHKRLQTLKEQNCEVVVFILNGVGEDTYKTIKYFGNQKLGIVTQCTDFVAIAKNIRARKLDMYLQNLVQKFNAKLGGVNGMVSLARALTSSSARDDVFMFFGADVTHITCSREKPSIAAVVGSVDSTSTQYASRVGEQYPARGKISLEIIKDLYQMSTDLLKLFAQKNGCFPNKIVFYRDGVDDGHFQKVLDNEIRALQNACKTLYMNNPLPKITFIIVKKRHNTRFFLQDPQTGSINNVLPGTIVDTNIVHPQSFDFYLNSHAAIQGTSRPILYHVLYDEIGFSSDEIQSLTYYLCHSDVRCTKAVSVPAPVHYAHLAAYQSRDAESFENDRKSTAGDFDDDELVEGIGSITLQEVESRLIQLDPSIQDTMWYV
ncbi:hypothetical protein I4U23_012848 [Adineta vaga]|nr:hypothetical protein I4U23_012848 [Adineta vaga]